MYSCLNFLEAKSIAFVIIYLFNFTGCSGPKFSATDLTECLELFTISILKRFRYFRITFN